MELWSLFVFLSLVSAAFSSPYINKFHPQRNERNPSSKRINFNINEIRVTSLPLQNSSSPEQEELFINAWNDKYSGTDITYDNYDEIFDKKVEKKTDSKNTDAESWETKETASSTPQNIKSTVEPENGSTQSQDIDYATVSTMLLDLDDVINTTLRPEDIYSIELDIDPDIHSAYNSGFGIDTNVQLQTEIPPTDAHIFNTNFPQDEITTTEPSEDESIRQFDDACEPHLQFKGKLKPFNGSSFAFKSPYGFVQEICHKTYFKSFYDVMLTWEEANAMCKSFNLTLLNFATVDEQNCMNQYFCDHVGHSFQFWTAGRNISSVSEVIWTPHVVDITITGNAPHHSGLMSNNNDCVLVTFKDRDQENRSYLSNEKCKSRQSFICE